MFSFLHKFLELWAIFAQLSKKHHPPTSNTKPCNCRYILKSNIKPNSLKTFFTKSAHKKSQSYDKTRRCVHNSGEMYDNFSINVCYKLDNNNALYFNAGEILALSFANYSSGRVIKHYVTYRFPKHMA